MPDGDEGLCPTCGTEFGHATVAMPALSKAKAKKLVADPSAPSTVLVEPGMSLPPGILNPPPNKSNKLMWILVVVFLVIAIGIGSVAAVLLSSKVNSDAPAPPAPTAPPAPAP